MKVFIVQIKTDRGNFVDYCGLLSSATFEFNTHKGANRAMARSQALTKGHGFQYRVVERDKFEAKNAIH